MTRGNQKAEGRGLKCVLATSLLVAFFAMTLSAKNGAYPSTAHGDRDKGPQRRTDVPRGSCMQCHDQHASHGGGAAVNGSGLFAPNDDTFCLTCHATPSDSGGFPGNAAWSQSSHALSSTVQQRSRDLSSSSDNKCAACHDPHGVKDRDGVIPAMLSVRSSELCMGCHDGSKASDIRSQLEKPYVHAEHARGSHDPHEGGDPTRFSALGNNRHADCADCHNVHQAAKDPSPPLPPEASSRLAGVSRVEVVNGGAGMLPAYRFHPASDPGTVNEFEICFKCHSSWTKQPPGQEDLARLTNPANPSFHPIQAPGRNSRIDPSSFANGWSADSLVACTSCHTSDDSIVRGPHGSNYPYMLKKPTSSGSQEPMQQIDICFDCHAYAVYADPSSDAMTLRASRFNGPAGEGHSYHVGTQHLACYACHDTHGSMRNAALVTTTHNPGITMFMQTPAGGTCTSNCHAPRTYSINYPR